MAVLKAHVLAFFFNILADFLNFIIIQTYSERLQKTTKGVPLECFLYV